MGLVKTGRRLAEDGSPNHAAAKMAALHNARHAARRGG